MLRFALSFPSSPVSLAPPHPSPVGTPTPDRAAPASGSFAVTRLELRRIRRGGVGPRSFAHDGPAATSSIAGRARRDCEWPSRSITRAPARRTAGRCSSCRERGANSAMTSMADVTLDGTGRLVFGDHELEVPYGRSCCASLQARHCRPSSPARLTAIRRSRALVDCDRLGKLVTDELDIDAPGEIATACKVGYSGRRRSRVACSPRSTRRRSSCDERQRHRQGTRRRRCAREIRRGAWTGAVSYEGEMAPLARARSEAAASRRRATAAPRRRRTCGPGSSPRQMPRGVEPGVELGRRPLVEQAAQRRDVVVAGRLVVEHDVVADRQRHQVRAAGGAEQDLEALELVLAHRRVIGEARVAAHRQAEQLAHEVILERGARDLRAVLEVLGADEADHGVDEERLVAPREAVAARLDRDLIGAVVRAPTTAPSPGRSRSTSGSGRASSPSPSSSPTPRRAA